MKAKEYKPLTEKDVTDMCEDLDSEDTVEVVHKKDVLSALSGLKEDLKTARDDGLPPEEYVQGLEEALLLVDKWFCHDEKSRHAATQQLKDV